MEQSNMNELTNQKLPNATAVLVLGILSIVTCCCYGVLGLILGIVALVLAKKDKALYAINPQSYTNYSNLNIGRILAIIGIALNVIYLLLTIWMIATFGFEGMQDPQVMQEKIREMMGQ
jgi:ABC-type sulfate transport system permease subunit